MGYQLGVDIGTTYSAAAVHRDGRATICTLGDRAATIPSVVLLRSDGTFLTGDAAVRRAVVEPERVGREFKRRFGDTTPIIVAGSPYSAEALTARLLAEIVGQVREREGSPPDEIVITHPANWGPYKTDLLRQAVSIAGLDVEAVGLTTEPEAAAVSYATQERVESGEVIAVYDLGGGTFDAAVLRRTSDGFAIVGKPEGIERLGGIDFDAALFAKVTSGLGTTLNDLDPNDPASLSAVARLRRDCVDAKEALSSDTDVSIPVMLPGLQTDVRITRHEFEALIRPSLLDSVDAMKRALQSADVGVDQVSRVLLVGGSSRIPVVAQLLLEELGRPLALDAHPKHTVATGAAYHAARLARPRGPGQRGTAPDPPPAVAAPSPIVQGSEVAQGSEVGRTRFSSPEQLDLPPAARAWKQQPAPAPVADVGPLPGPSPHPAPRDRGSVAPARQPAPSDGGVKPGLVTPGKARPVSNPRLRPPGSSTVTGPPANSPRRTPASPNPHPGAGTPLPAAAPPSASPSPAVPSPAGAGDGPDRGRPRRREMRLPSGLSRRSKATGHGADAATAVFNEATQARTSVYQPGVLPDRTSVYPQPGVSATDPSVAASPGGSPGRRRRPMRWIIALLIIVALLVAGGIVAGQALAIDTLDVGRWIPEVDSALDR